MHLQVLLEPWNEIITGQKDWKQWLDVYLLSYVLLTYLNFFLTNDVCTLSKLPCILS